MTVFLGIDPGSIKLGWAIVNEHEIVDGGVVSSSRASALDDRFLAIYDQVTSIMEKAKAAGVRLVIMETFSNTANRQGVDAIHGTMAIVRLIAKQAGLVLRTIQPVSIKKNICGDHWAGKEAVADAVGKRYPSTFQKVSFDHNAVDAVSHAVYGWAIIEEQEGWLRKAMKTIEGNQGIGTVLLLTKRRPAPRLKKEDLQEILNTLKERYEYHYERNSETGKVRTSICIFDIPWRERP